MIVNMKLVSIEDIFMLLNRWFYAIKLIYESVYRVIDLRFEIHSLFDIKNNFRRI